VNRPRKDQQAAHIKAPMQTQEDRVSHISQFRLADFNERRATIEWQLTSRQARVKLQKLYPVVTTQLD
jgi:hypothetical protein